MFTLLAKIFIKKTNDYVNPDVRRKYGMLSGAVGIFLNVLLFSAKLTIGLISKSVAITADALNNLSDAGSSIITILGFRLASKKPDAEHPFGHGRIEYVSGLIVAMLILLMAFELAHSSIESILHPQKIESSPQSLIVLLIAIGIKIYMYLYNHLIAKKINSAAIEATAKDCLSDTFATFLVFASILAAKFTDFPIDGWAGLVVATFIFFAGYEAAKDTIEPLLGQAPKKEFVDEIINFVLQHKKIVGVHDIIVHDYGPGRLMISLHAEVPGDDDIYELHELIDTLEFSLSKRFSCTAVIHMDPIETNNKKLADLKVLVKEELHTIHKDLTLHDFRIVPGEQQTNIIFDAVQPRSCTIDSDELEKLIIKKVNAMRKEFKTIVHIDQDFN